MGTPMEALVLIIILTILGGVIATFFKIPIFWFAGIIIYGLLFILMNYDFLLHKMKSKKKKK